jgi:C4-dicarboxylate-specific signal transduction histidine kinase
MLEKIFEPFFTSKGRDRGTGPGLSISQRIIEEHGGRISGQRKLLHIHHGSRTDAIGIDDGNVLQPDMRHC